MTNQGINSYIDKLWDIYKELVSLKNKEDVVITAPRRSGKSTLIRNLLAAYSEVLSKNEILFVAPQKRHKILNFEPYTTPYSVRGLNPKILLVEEAAYCKNELLEQTELFRDREGFIKAIYISTPRRVEYKFDEGKDRWVSNCYFKNLIDDTTDYYIIPVTKPCHGYYQFRYLDYPAKYREYILAERDYFSNDQWKMEIEGEFICKYDFSNKNKEKE